MAGTILVFEKLEESRMTRLEERFEVIRAWKERDLEQLIRGRGADITAVISSSLVTLRAPLIQALPNLGVVSTYSSGTTHIDVKELEARGVALGNTPSVASEDVADLAMGMTVALMRRLVEGDMAARFGKWRDSKQFLSPSLNGKTMGVFGMGAIGQGLARRAEAFGMNILYSSRTPKNDLPYEFVSSISALAEQSDVLALCCPGNPQTKGIVNAGALEALGPKGYLVNVARAVVIDKDALITALANRKIAGAALDVFWDEPEVPKELVTMDNVVLAPHIGWATHESFAAMEELVLENIFAFFDGKPLPGLVLPKAAPEAATGT